MNKGAFWSFIIVFCFLIFANCPTIEARNTEKLYNHHYDNTDLKKISIEIQDYKDKENSEKNCSAYISNNKNVLLLPVKAIELTGWDITEVEKGTYKLNYKDKSYIYDGEYISDIHATSIFSLNVNFHGFTKADRDLFTVSNKKYVSQRWPWLIERKGYLEHPNPIIRGIAVLLLGK